MTLNEEPNNGPTDDGKLQLQTASYKRLSKSLTAKFDNSPQQTSDFN